MLTSSTCREKALPLAPGLVDSEALLGQFHQFLLELRLRISATAAADYARGRSARGDGERSSRATSGRHGIQAPRNT